MPEDDSSIDSDLWSEWLLHHRFGDDPDFEQAARIEMQRYAERVLDATGLAPGMTLADIGTGDGLVAFKAIERVGATLRLILTDISTPVLRQAEAQAMARGVHGQCSFLQCPADRLGGIASESVDVVTTRAVLAYVGDKSAALREFHRILKPAGRLSIAEPILQDDALAAAATRELIASGDIAGQDRFLRLITRWKSAQYPDTAAAIASSPIANFSERSLFDAARAVGFARIHLELHMDMAPSIVRSWDVFLRLAPHPWAPTLDAILADRFTLEEREFFERKMRPIVESPQAVTTTRIAYLSAAKSA
jgi:ubiquinone/menaquinone biosynthesis C-methylase UbiE